MNKEMQIFHKCAQNDIGAYCNEDIATLEDLAKHYGGIRSFEMPDIIFPTSNKLYAIEHFEFDSSKNIRKGSQSKQKLAERNNAFDRDIESMQSLTEPVLKRDSDNCVYTSDNYISNFKKVFSSHYNRIDTYKQNLIVNGHASKLTEISMCFFIQDTTLLGSYMFAEEFEPCNLFFIPEVLDFIEQAKDVDFIFHAYFAGQKYRMNFMSNTEKTIQILREQQYSNFHNEYWTFQPKEIRYAIPTEL